MVEKTRHLRKAIDPPAFPSARRGRTIGPDHTTSGNGRETDRERITKVEALLEKIKADLDIQMGRTAAIQAQLDMLVAKQSL